MLSPGFTIIAVNEAYLSATKRTRSELVGRVIFEVFPDNADLPEANGVANLRASLLRVLEGKATDVMPLQRYDIPVEGAAGTCFEERHWNAVNTPVLDERGAVAYIIHHIDDVAALVLGQAREAQMSEEIAAQTKELTELQQWTELFQPDALRDLKTAADISYTVSEILGETLGVSRVGYGMIDLDAETIAVGRD